MDPDKDATHLRQSGQQAVRDDAYRQRFAELIVRELDITGQLTAEFAATYARHGLSSS